MEAENKREDLSNIDHLLDLEQHRLAVVLERTKTQMLKQFQSLRQSVLAQKSTFHQSPSTADKILNITLPFWDKSRHLREKLNNTLPFKQIIMNTHVELSKTTLLTKEEERGAKNNFDLICDYKKRSEQKLSGKELYTEGVCKHLVRRTFKKTATELYEMVASAELGVRAGGVRVVCVGGGPGSDLCGVVAHLLELGVDKCEGVVFDYNHERWEAVAGQLGNIISNEAKKWNIPFNLSIEWRHLDMTQKIQESVGEICALNPEIVTCCWALNEDSFVPGLWRGLIEGLPGCTFLFLDGERFPLEHMLEFKGGRRLLYSGFESPRSMIIYPLGQ